MSISKRKRISVVLSATALTTAALACGASTARASSDDPGNYQHVAVFHTILNSKFTKKSGSLNDFSVNICATDHAGHVTIWKNDHEARDYWYVPLCVHNDPNQTDNVDPGMGTGPYTFYIAPVPGDPNPPSNFCFDFSQDHRTYSPNSYRGGCAPGSDISASIQ